MSRILSVPTWSNFSKVLQIVGVQMTFHVFDIIFYGADVWTQLLQLGYLSVAFQLLFCSCNIFPFSFFPKKFGSLSMSLVKGQNISVNCLVSCMQNCSHWKLSNLPFTVTHWDRNKSSTIVQVTWRLPKFFSTQTDCHARQMRQIIRS